MTEDLSLKERLDFMHLDEGVRTRIRGMKPLIMETLPAALDTFYDRVRATPATRACWACRCRKRTAASAATTATRSC